ncbi:MAG: hypothetical protein AMJ81_05700 [Phycisphaerae bacterium SM23_33]|nr:MAG: hypothetical protein AMJ81_05700 [Phycisphaerae bacterium SM23_33]
MVVACVAIAIMLGVLVWTVPRFESLLAESGATLPRPTRAILQASHLVKSWPMVFLPLAGLVMAGLICLPLLVRRPAVRVIGPAVLTLLIGAVLVILWSLYAQLVRVAGEMR